MQSFESTTSHSRSMGTPRDPTRTSTIHLVWGDPNYTSGCLPPAPGAGCWRWPVVIKASTTSSLPRPTWVSAPPSWVGTCSARSGARGATSNGSAGGVTTRRITTLSSCSPTIHVHRSRCRVARPFISSLTVFKRRSKEHSMRRMAATSGSVAGRPRFREYLRAGLIDEMHVAIVPVLLGNGERLFEHLDGSGGYECVEFVSSPSVSHVPRCPERKGPGLEVVGGPTWPTPPPAPTPAG